MEPGRDAGVPGLGRRDDGRRRSVLLRHRPPAVRPRPQPGPRGPRSPKARVTRPVTAQGRRITLPLDFAFPGSAARGRERRRAPAERSQVDGEQIVDVRTEEFRVGLRERPRHARRNAGNSGFSRSGATHSHRSSMPPPAGSGASDPREARRAGRAPNPVGPARTAPRADARDRLAAGTAAGATAVDDGTSRLIPAAASRSVPCVPRRLLKRWNSSRMTRWGSRVLTHAPASTRRRSEIKGRARAELLRAVTDSLRRSSISRRTGLRRSGSLDAVRTRSSSSVSSALR